MQSLLCALEQGPLITYCNTDVPVLVFLYQIPSWRVGGAYDILKNE